MSLTTASRPKLRPNADMTKDSRAGAEGVEPALLRLVRALEDVARLNKGGTPPPPDAGENEFSGRDEDDDHVYLWVAVPDYSGPDIDINLHGRALMIRFAKSMADS